MGVRRRLKFPPTGLGHHFYSVVSLAAEEKGEDEDDDDDFGGVRQSELVNWYLKEMEHEIESVAELNEMELLVKKVINKLINQVRCNKLNFSVHLKTHIILKCILKSTQLLIFSYLFP